MASRSRARKRTLPWYLRPFKWLLWFAIGSAAWVLVYAVVPPPVTFTMLADSNGITKDWTSLSAIDRNMVRADYLPDHLRDERRRERGGESRDLYD